MRIDPITDSLVFIAGGTADHEALGPARYALVAVYAGLLIGSLAALAANWRRHPAQRSGRNLAVWAMRVLLGTMWFQGALWKLPLPLSGGLRYWTNQMAKYSAFDWHRRIVTDVLVPNLSLLGPLTFLTELGLAASLILGLGVRLGGVISALWTVNLWIGLYRAPTEWPWTYVCIIMTSLLLAFDQAGRRLGVDALIASQQARRPSAFGRLWGVVS